uniref:Uncharacterized protein n=1 Tax=Rhizophora mucronata TaxID=61149 RepID=A0A2P2IYM0_RHIMU
MPLSDLFGLPGVWYQLFL